MTNELMTAGIPTSAVLVGILVNNSRLSDLRAHMDMRFDELKAAMVAHVEATHADLLRWEQAMDARLRHLEER